MKLLLNAARIAITGLLTMIHLLWQWALNTTLITMVAGFVVFLATQNIQQFDLAFYQELFREYALFASIGVAVIFILNRAFSIISSSRLRKAFDEENSHQAHQPHVGKSTS